MNEYDKLPECVFDLLHDVLEDRDAVDPYLPESENEWRLRQADAYEICWGWNPPLLDPGTIDITLQGLAALSWRRQQPTMSDDVPAEYCDTDGTPLTLAYLLEDPRCKWQVFEGESRNGLSNKLRHISHVRIRAKGNPVAYHYEDLRRLIDEKYEDEDRLT